MAKTLKASEKRVIVDGKTAIIDGSLYTGFGTGRRSFLLHNGKLVSDANGKPYRAVGLSPVMDENTWAEIGNAIKHYREIGCPWALGDYKKIRFSIDAADTYAGGYEVYEPTYAISHENNVCVLEGKAFLVGVKEVHGGCQYTFALNPKINTDDNWETGYISHENRSYYGYFEQDENIFIYHQNELIRILASIGTSLNIRNNFGNAYLVDIKGKANVCYDTASHNYPDLVSPSSVGVAKPTMYINLPSIRDFSPGYVVYNDYYPPKDCVRSASVTIKVKDFDLNEADYDYSDGCVVRCVPWGLAEYTQTFNPTPFQNCILRTLANTYIGRVEYKGYGTENMFFCKAFSQIDDPTDISILTSTVGIRRPQMAIFGLRATYDD